MPLDGFVAKVKLRDAPFVRDPSPGYLNLRPRGGYKPKGRHCIKAAACPGDTCLSRVARRLAFVLFADSKCLKPGVRRMSWPVAVSLKRFATDFLVFCIEYFTPMGSGLLDYVYQDGSGFYSVMNDRAPSLLPAIRPTRCVQLWAVDLIGRLGRGTRQ